MSKDDFLGRWSKRKLEGEPEKPDARDGETAEAVTEQVSETAPLDEAQIALLEDGGGSLVESVDEDQGESEGEEHEPHPAEGIDIEKLEYDSDFTVFMDKKVPKALKRMALRKLWLSNPILANVDGLNDYDEDFSDAAAIFINSAGKVISGAREQIWDDDQIAEGQDRIGTGEDEEDTRPETAETEPEQAEDVEVSQVEDIEDAEVEDIEDFEDLELANHDDGAEQAKTPPEDVEKTQDDGDKTDA
jgi:Protein of unknown function (DUF3306)